MRFFNLFRRKESAPACTDEDFETVSAKLLDGFEEHDYLGKAAAAGDKARECTKSGDLNSAWAFYQEMKAHYLKHALREGFTTDQTLALDSSTSKPLAEILRLECKHPDALVHMVYWAACHSKPTPSLIDKLRPYFNRCKFVGVSLQDLEALVMSCRATPDFMRVRETIREWSERT